MALLASIGVSCVAVLGSAVVGEAGGDVMVPVGVASSSGCEVDGCGDMGEGGGDGEGVVGSVGAESSSERRVPSVSSSEVLVFCVSSWRRMSSIQSKWSSCIGESGS